MKPKMSNRDYAIRLFIAVVILIVASLKTMAQDVSQYDHGTPPQHAAGLSSIGSYISADLGTVNLSNGALNFKLPLGTVGGRGFSLPLTLNYTSKLWSASTGKQHIFDPFPSDQPIAYAVYDDPARAEDIYYKLGAGWSVGSAPYIKVRGVGIGAHKNPVSGCTDFNYVLVKLTVVLPDRGEIELRDDATDGAPGTAVAFNGGCKTQDNSYRGKRWHATDGSGAVFYSDVDNGIVLNGNLAGKLIMPDGTVYRFIDAGYGNSAGAAYLHNLGRCTSVTDRNGNQILITYPTANKVIYTDQLNRQTTLEINDPTLAPVVLRVTWPGYNGAQRVYTVRTDTMNLHYRADNYTTMQVINGDYDPLGLGGWGPPHISLFSTSYESGSQRIDNVNVVTQVTLPDGRALNFNYNQFGEVAEVTMPTGGKVQYDFGSVAYNSGTGIGLATGNTLDCEAHPTPSQVTCDVRALDRAVTARRTYPDGSTLEATWTYTYKAANSNGVTTNGKTEVKCTSAQGAVLMDQWHYFKDAQRFLAILSGSADGTGYSLWSTGLERRGEMLDSNGTTVLSANEEDWMQRAAVSWTGYTSQQIANDNRVNKTRRYLDDGGVTFSEIDTSYDETIALQNHVNNPIELKEYDFDDHTTPKRRTTTQYLTGGHYTGTGVNTVNLLSLPTQQSVFDGNGTELARTMYEYDSYIDDSNRASLVDHGTVTGHDSGYGTGFTERGNPTQISRIINGSAFIYTYPRYDTLGNVISTKDPRLNVTTIDYLDDFGDGSNPGFNAGSHSTYSLPTKITSPPPNVGETAHTAFSQYDYNTGLLTGFKDRNGVITQTIYNDLFDRPTQVKAALGTSLENHTAMYYAPTSVFGISLTNNDVLTAKDQVSFDGNLRSWTHTDGFGRTFESWTSDPQGDVKVTAVYDGLGRAVQTSNPFRPSVPETQYNTTTAYDLLGRVTTVTTADNAVVTTAYSGARVLVTDQAGKQRISQTDGLGRLTDVWEVTAADSATESVTFPGSTVATGYRTTYSYDALDDLTLTTQKLGATPKQTRTFYYDGLKRLTQAINPESGTVNYTYDENSNLATKQDARLITTTYGYDALNRVASRTYSGSTPGVSYKYDAQTLPTGAPSFTRGSSTGRLVAVTYGGSSAGNYTGYDQLGRANVSYQQTDSNNYSFGYSYNLASEMTSQTYPSGRVVQTEFDSAGRTAGVRNQGASWYYAGSAAADTANRIQYASQGAVSAMKLGNGKWEHTSFNNRLQPTLIGLGTSTSDSSVLKLDYTYNTTGQTNNNGNVVSQTITIATTVMTDSFGYDALNRLSSASETGAASWSQNYGFDRFGNRWFSSGSYLPNPTLTPQAQAAFNQSTNRLSASQYDNAGNQTTDAATSGFTYDAENRQISSNVGGTYVTYNYDGDGRRVKKVVGTSTTIFVYNAGGQLIAEYTSPDQISTNGLSYLTSDHLGSTRVVTDINGYVKSRHDYLPFGEEIGTDHRPSGLSYGATDGERQKFTGKERDNESGLDYFLARYYSSAQGRFTSPDEFKGGPLEVPYLTDNETRKQALAYADVVSPQSFNKYGYCLNNPLHYIDPDGHDWRTVDEKDKDGNLVRNYVWDRNYIHQEGDESGVGNAGANGTRYYEYVDTQGRAISMWGDANKDSSKEADHGHQVVTANEDKPGQALYTNGKGEAPRSYVDYQDAAKAVRDAGYKQVWDPEPSHKGGTDFVTKRSPTLHITLYPKHQSVEHHNSDGTVTYTQRYINQRSTFHVDRWTQGGSWKALVKHLEEYYEKKK